MGRIILITGGIRSGKSSYAEQRVKKEKEILYIATSIITDYEMEDRVKKHKQRRGNRYTTFEGYKNIDEVIKKDTKECILLECVGTMISNIIFDNCYNEESKKYMELDELPKEKLNDIEKEIYNYIERIVFNIKQTKKEVYIITNEVGMSLVANNKLGRYFSDLLGRVNQYIAKNSEEVVLLVSGIPLKIKQGN